MNKVITKATLKDDLKVVIAVFLQIAAIAGYVLAKDWLFNEHKTANDMTAEIVNIMILFTMLRIAGLRQELRKNGTLD